MKIKRIKGEEADEIVRLLKENDGYCPCRAVKTPETKCMCVEFLNASAPYVCHCGLYEKTEN